MKTLLISFLIINMNLANDLIIEIEDHDWNLVREHPSIQIYDTQQENRKFKTFHLQGHFGVSLAQVENIIEHPEYLVDWFPMAAEARLVNQTANEMIVQVYFDFPFPMKNRDAYIRVTKEFTKEQEIRFTMELANGYDLTPGYERLFSLSSETTLTQSGTEVIIDQVTYLDPGGTIPKMFLNTGLPISMLKSFEKLEALAGKIPVDILD